jgi:hypothetical protein
VIWGEGAGKAGKHKTVEEGILGVPTYGRAGVHISRFWGSKNGANYRFLRSHLGSRAIALLAPSCCTVAV